MDQEAWSESPVEFYLGRECDPKTTEPTGKPILYPSRDLTTHGVVVGMTGSGKTGLCLSILEEAALDGIPAILIDPKGDMSNLLLGFPDLKPEDFEPWVNPEDAVRAGTTTKEFASKVAARWKEGLAESGQDGERIRRLNDAAEFRIYTPGSDAGLPVALAKSFPKPPASSPPEDVHERATATVSALLGLAGVDADPIRSREHILLANLLLHRWSSGQDVTVEQLIADIQNPPIRKLGVFDVDTFYPEKDRQSLTLAINNVLASPALSSWRTGEPLDLVSMLASPAGKARVLIFSIAHLNDEQRMFFVTLLLEELVGWMRQQGGTSELRLLVYFDEVFGYLPPHPHNPPSKQPLMTMLKQGRAFGLGVLLATQNPVDLDYKSLSNAGSWWVGKLQTERDKARLLDGLEGAASSAGSLFDRSAIDRVISTLANRRFFFHNVHADRPKIMQTRWAMSYLRGPLGKEQIQRLMKPFKSPPPAPAAPSTPSAPSGDGAFRQNIKEESLATHDAPLATGGVPPVLPRDLSQYFLPILRPKKAALGSVGSANVEARLLYFPRLVAQGIVRFIDRKRGVEAVREYRILAEAPESGFPVDWSAGETLEELEMLSAAEADDGFWQEVPTSANESKEIKQFLKDFQRHLYDTAAFQLLVNTKLGLASGTDETPDQFLSRCRSAAAEQRDAEAAKLKPKFDKKIDLLEEKVRRGRQDLDEKESEHAARRRTEVFHIGEAIMKFFLGRRRISDVSQASTKRGRTERARLDVDEARENLEEFDRQMDAVRAEWEKVVSDLNDKWVAIADAIDETRISPRKTDVSVPIFGLGWAPFWECRLSNGSLTLIPAYRRR